MFECGERLQSKTLYTAAVNADGSRGTRGLERREAMMTWRPVPPGAHDNNSVASTTQDYDDKDPWIHRFISKADDGEMRFDVKVKRY